MISKYDPWKNALVWFAETQQSIWRPGKVLRHETTEGKAEWTFTIELDGKSAEGAEGETTVDLFTIVTPPVDQFMLEFVSVKKRDKDPSVALHISDMTSLSFLNEPEMIECLRMRYFAKHIYTNIGPILVAVNPFEQLEGGVYSADTMEKYFSADQGEVKQLGPHVFQIGNSAYSRMFIDKFDPDKRENQSILVNGESGAGKTESTKQVLRFLALNSSRLVSTLPDDLFVKDVEALIHAVNPITESFGNAKTSRNNNSSRFGKFIELDYTAEGYVHGAHIDTYLLETVRVTSQLKGERNYHVFYEVFAALSEENRAKWSVHSLKDFCYVNTSGEYHRHDGEKDIDNYCKLVDALAMVDVSETHAQHLFGLVMAILHIGNLRFKQSTAAGDDAALFDDKCRVHVQAVMLLLGIEEEALYNAVTTRSIKVAGNVIQKKLNVEAATAARDVLAKTTYDLVFRSVLQAVNGALAVEDDGAEETASFVGVLDIFGFEYFQKNSFEQLCINYANEKLQDHFNYAIFKSEQEVYEEEGIKWVFREYPDNSGRLELFEHKRTGLFLLCDEQLKIPKPSDEKLAQSFYAKAIAHPYFTASKGEKAKMEFVVNHFATDVRYSAVGFVEKNRNDIAQEIYDTFETSHMLIVRNLPAITDDKVAKKVIREHSGVIPFHATGGHERTSSIDGSDLPVAAARHRSSSYSRQGSALPAMGRLKKATSLANQFSKQLQDLILKIRSTRSHFIRCIKPNNQLLAHTFDYDMVMNQLRCGGALGAVQVFHAGFPNRMDFKHFVCRYSAFLVVCGVNALTKDLLKVMSRARSTGSDALWRLGSSMLIDIVSLTLIVLNLIDGAAAELAEEVDVLHGLQMGKTQVFMRAPVFELLERLHVRSLSVIANRLQRRRRATLLQRASGGLATTGTAAAEAVMHAALLRRQTARKCVSATLVLQRRVRVFLAMCRLQRALRGFTLFKAHFRGYKARLFVRKWKYAAARTVQKTFRCYLGCKRYNIMRRSAVVLQAITRMHTARVVRCKKVKLVRLLQRLWRGTMARIQTYIIRQKLKQAQQEAQRRAEEAKKDFMVNLDSKLKSNPNLLFDMLGASEKIALLSRQHEALMLSNRMLEEENATLQRDLNRANAEVADLRQTVQSIRGNVDGVDVFSFGEVHLEAEYTSTGPNTYVQMEEVPHAPTSPDHMANGKLSPVREESYDDSEMWPPLPAAMPATAPTASADCSAPDVMAAPTLAAHSSESVAGTVPADATAAVVSLKDGSSDPCVSCPPSSALVSDPSPVKPRVSTSTTASDNSEKTANAPPVESTPADSMSSVALGSAHMDEVVGQKPAAATVEAVSIPVQNYYSQKVTTQEENQRVAHATPYPAQISPASAPNSSTTAPPSGSGTPAAPGTGGLASPSRQTLARPPSQQVCSVDHLTRILLIARDAVSELTKSLQERSGRKDTLAAAIGESELKASLLQYDIEKIRLKKESGIRELAAATAELSYQQTEKILTPKKGTTADAHMSTNGGVAVGDPVAQAAYLNLQIETLKKRKATTEKLLTTLKADKKLYTSADVRATESGLAEITANLRDMEDQLAAVTSSTASLKRTGAVSAPPNPPTTPTPEGGGKTLVVEAAALSSDTSRRALALDDMMTGMSVHMDGLERQLAEVQGSIVAMKKEFELLVQSSGTDERRVAKIRQIVLFLSSSSTSSATDSPQLVKHADALWEVQELNQKNAALADELSRVKQRFTSVLGRMDGFSLGNFRLQMAGSNTEGCEGSNTTEKVASVKLDEIPRVSAAGEESGNKEQQDHTPSKATRSPSTASQHTPSTPAPPPITPASGSSNPSTAKSSGGLRGHMERGASFSPSSLLNSFTSTVTASLSMSTHGASPSATPSSGNGPHLSHSSSVKLPTPPPRKHRGILGSIGGPSTDIDKPSAAPSSSDAPAQSTRSASDVVTTPSSPWCPSFIGTVSSYTRSGRREIVFGVAVRSAAELVVSEWTVMRSLTEFKNLRAKLKNYSSVDIDNSFPTDQSPLALFSISNEVAEYRMEALNTYLLSVCGCPTIMSNESGAAVVREFLEIDAAARRSRK